MMMDKRMREAASLRGNRWQSAFVAVAMGMVAMPAFSQSMWQAVEPENRLCTAGFNQDYGWFSVDGLLGVHEAPGALDVGTCLFAASSVGMNLGGKVFPLNGDVVYSLPSTYNISAQLSEPALCEDYYGGTGELPNRWKLHVKDANNDSIFDAVNGIRGVDSLIYDLAASALAPSMVGAYGATPWLRCHSGLDPNFQPDPVEPSNPDRIHGDGFEDPVQQSSEANLQVQFYKDEAATIPLAGDVVEQTNAPGETARYLVRIKNIGTDIAHGVRVREFVPTNASLLATTAARVSCIDRGSAPTGGTPCATGNGVPFFKDIGNLAADAHYDFVFERRSNGTVGGAQALIQVAAFANPGTTTESVVADNSRALRINVVNNIQVTYQVSTNDSVGNTSGGGISVGGNTANCTPNPPSGSVLTCPPGTDGLVFTASANANYTFTGFSDSLACGVSTGVNFTGGTYTTNTATTCTVTANFRTKPTVTLNPIANGTINTPTNPQTVHYGDGNPATTADNAVFVVTPNPGWSVVSATGCPSASHANNGNGTWTITAENVQAPCALTVGLFEAQYTVTATVLPGGDGQPHGTVFGSSTAVVGYHANGVSFSFNAQDATYSVDAITTTCGGGSWYAHPNIPLRYVFDVDGGVISSDCVVEAKFERIRHDVKIDPLMTDTLANGHIEFIASGTTEVVDPFNAKVVHQSNVSVRMVPKIGYHYVGNSLTGSAACHNIGGDAVGPTVEDTTANVEGWLGQIDGQPSGDPICMIAASFAPNAYTVRVRLAEGEDGSHGTISCHPDFAVNCQEILLDEEDENSPVAEVVITNVVHGPGNNVKVSTSGVGGYVPWFPHSANACGFGVLVAPTYRSDVVTASCASTVEFVQ